MKTIFINTCTQEDYFKNDNLIKILPQLESVRPKLRALTEFAKENKIKVVNIVSWNDPKNKWFSNTPDFKDTYPQHCIMNSEGTNFIPETLVDSDYFLVKWDAPYIVFPDIHKHRNLIIFKNSMNLIEGNKFADSVFNNLGTVLMSRPNYIVYGINAGSVARDLTRRGYSVKLISDASQDFSTNPINYEESGIELVTSEYVLSTELE